MARKSDKRGKSGNNNAGNSRGGAAAEAAAAGKLAEANKGAGGPKGKAASKKTYEGKLAGLPQGAPLPRVEFVTRSGKPIPVSLNKHQKFHRGDVNEDVVRVDIRGPHNELLATKPVSQSPRKRKFSVDIDLGKTDPVMQKRLQDADRRRRMQDLAGRIAERVVSDRQGVDANYVPVRATAGEVVEKVKEKIEEGIKAVTKGGEKLETTWRVKAEDKKLADELVKDIKGKSFQEVSGAIVALSKMAEGTSTESSSAKIVSALLKPEEPGKSDDPEKPGGPEEPEKKK